jgi:outer membrane protein OmpA-like peptidoglycan-associated protein
MKKFFLMLAVAASAMTASAQEPKSGFADAKFWDNWYLGANAGVLSTAKHQAVLKNLNPTFGVRFGKWFTPSVGIAAEGEFLFGNKFRGEQLTDPSLFHGAKVHLLGTLNFSNAFGGYTGTPRSFEVIGLAGIGFIHNFGTKVSDKTSWQLNMLSSKLGLDFAWNFGSEKEWQFYVEPAVTYVLGGAENGQKIQYNSNYANLELNVGVNYYFKTSNGTRDFKTYDVGALLADNARLQAELDKKPKEVVKVVTVQEPVKTDAVTTVNTNDTYVFFAYDSAELSETAKKALDKIGQNGVYCIKGYASSEGSTEYNKTLSQKRADVVKTYLEARGCKIDSAEGLGVVFGPTTGRVAVVSVK